MSIVLRDQFLLEMEDNLKDVFILGFENAKAWEQVYKMAKTDKRRVEVDSVVHPSVTAITQEGAPLNRLTVKRGYNSWVVPDTFTGEVKISHEFIADNRYPEIEKNSFGLGKALQRRRYKDACAYIYNAFSGVTSPDNAPVFSNTHNLISGNGAYGQNLLFSHLSTDSLDAAVTLLSSMLDENGDTLPLLNHS